ncbi:MAG: hypothetical protein JXX14_17135, partial [Deltaproteobacteria bacterium]|nr:hypothetical protein [Deltaproteobacteria bacterium]
WVPACARTTNPDYITLMHVNENLCRIIRHDDIYGSFVGKMRSERVPAPVSMLQTVHAFN